MKKKLNAKVDAPIVPRPATRETRGKPFASGNKSGIGRPKGSLNKRTLMARELLDENSPAIIHKMQLLALEGNVQMLRILASHILPLPNQRPCKIGPLRMSNNREIALTVKATASKAYSGEITFSQARESFDLMERVLRMKQALKYDDARVAEQKRITKSRAAERSEAFDDPCRCGDEDLSGYGDSELDDDLIPDPAKPSLSQLDGSDPTDDGGSETPALKKDPKPLPDAA